MDNENLSQEPQTEENHDTQSEENEPEPQEEESLRASLEAELEASREEIRRLSAVIGERERADREKAEFSEYFPEVSPSEIPDAVREKADREGIPLIVAYALYARKLELAALRVGDAVKSACERSAGPVSGASREADFFTVEQIRAMTPKEVRKHYKTIMKSLNKG